MAPCSVCKGSGEFCEDCRQPLGACTCPEGPSEAECDVCDGTGEED